MLMLFVCFSVFLCVVLFSGLMPDRFAIAQAALDNRLHGVIHAGGILTEGFGERKTHRGKKERFFLEF